MMTIRTSMVAAALLLAPTVWADDLTNPDLIKKGEYLSRVGDCVACHTSKNGKPYAGGLPMATPIGTVYSTNITPDPDTGIGTYSLEDFDKAVRHGIEKSGYTLYPAMPYPSYAKVTDDDIKALYAYFMKGVEPVVQANQETDIPWPLSMRWPLSIWRGLFAPEVAASQAPASAPDGDAAQLQRGAYLVQGLGHCGSCHTPRALTLQEKALDDSDPSYLSGGQVIDGWVAINLRGNRGDGLGAWSEEDIIQTLKNGRNDHFSSIGAMNDVIQHSGQHLSDADLLAIAKYLKSLPATTDAANLFQASEETAHALQSGKSIDRGGELYVDNCAACHRTDGQGASGVFPRLAGNPSVLSGDPSSMIRVILAGSRLPSTKETPSDLVMPDFGWRLSDEEAAQLVSFIRSSWGNKAAAVSTQQVTAVRKAISEEHQTPLQSSAQLTQQH